MVTGAPAAVCGVRLRGPDLRSRLVPATAALGRVVCGVPRDSPGHLHGRHVPGQSPAPALHQRPPSPAARVRRPGAWHRRHGCARPVRGARDRRCVYRHCRYGAGQPVPARHRRWCLSAATDGPDGSDAACHRTVGGSDAVRRVVAWLLLRREPCGRSDGVRAGRLLPAAVLRHGDGDAGRGGIQRRGGAPGVRYRTRDAICPVGHSPGDSGCGSGRAIRLCGHCAVWHDGTGCRGRVDATSVAAVRRHHVHLLVDPRGVPGRARDREHDRIRAGASRGTSSGRARLVPAAAVRDTRVGRLCDREFAAVLADQSVVVDQLGVPVRARLDAHDLGHATLDDPVGCQFSTRACCRGAARPGPRAPRGRRLRRQYGGCHRRRAGHRTRPGRHGRESGRTAGIDRVRGALWPVAARQNRARRTRGCTIRRHVVSACGWDTRRRRVRRRGIACACRAAASGSTGRLWPVCGDVVRHQ